MLENQNLEREESIRRAQVSVRLLHLNCLMGNNLSFYLVCLYLGDFLVVESGSSVT